MKHNVKFGTGGFRAIIGEEYNKYNVELICQSISNIIIKNNLKREVVIGFDNRFGSDYFAKWCAEVFAGNNISVKFNKLSVTTPVAMYASVVENNDYGIMITASHNPYNYNGIKVFYKGKDASIDDTNLIEQEMANTDKIKRVDFDTEVGNLIQIVNYDRKFIDFLVNNQSLLGRGSGLTIVYDAMFGSSVRELKYLSKKMDIKKYEIINSKHNAFFNFVAPEPSEKKLSKLKSRVLKLNADLGFALDSDGDRLAVIDNQGNYIDNNVILAVCYYYLIKYCNKSGPSIKNCCTSNLLDVVTKKLGYDCYSVDVGFKNISSKLLETKAVIGGENSGGLAVDNHILGKDSMISIGLIIRMVSDMGKPFSEIVKEVRQFAGNYNYINIEKTYHFKLEEKNLIKNLIKEKLDSIFSDYKIQFYDKDCNFKLFFADNEWLCIRFSGTEPIIRLFVEMNEKDKLNDAITRVEKFLKDYLIL